MLLNDRSETAYPVRSLTKGLELLLLFRSPEQPIRLAETARALKIAPSTVHRLLAMLIARGFVRQDSKTHAYFAGATLLEYAHLLVGEGVLRRAAAAEMELLASRTHETVVLAVLRGERRPISSRRSKAGISPRSTRFRRVSVRPPMRRRAERYCSRS